MVSLEEFRKMEVDETAAYNLYKEETNKAKKRKLYKAFQAIQDANETKRFLILVK
jgi:hypothetical protein